MIRNLLLVAALVLSPVAAQAGAPAVVSGGPRVGLSSDSGTDQIVLGGQLSLPEFAPDWSFVPSLELGFGDDASVIALNFDALYHLRFADSDWRPYLGGGLGVGFVSVDLPPPYHDASDTVVGVNAVMGFSVPTNSGDHWFAELRLGLGDLPDLKIIGGFNFKM